MIAVLVDKMIRTQIVDCAAVANWIFSADMAHDFTRCVRGGVAMLGHAPAEGLGGVGAGWVGFGRRESWVGLGGVGVGWVWEAWEPGGFGRRESRVCKGCLCAVLGRLYVWEILYSTIRKMNKHVQKINKELEESKEKLEKLHLKRVSERSVCFGDGLHL